MGVVLVKSLVFVHAEEAFMRPQPDRVGRNSPFFIFISKLLHFFLIASKNESLSKYTLSHSECVYTLEIPT